MIVVFMGPPGCGKGTQAKKLSHSHAGWTQLSTGDLLRVAIHEGSPLGQEAQNFIEQGDLVPDALVIELIQKQIQTIAESTHLVLDGFPRNEVQAQALEVFLKNQKRWIHRVIFFQISDQDLVKRLAGRRTCFQCGALYHIALAPSDREGICNHCQSVLMQREDDFPERIQKRLLVYHQQTEPLIAYYQMKSILHCLDASQSVCNVATHLSQILYE